MIQMESGYAAANRMPAGRQYVWMHRMNCTRGAPYAKLLNMTDILSTKLVNDNLEQLLADIDDVLLGKASLIQT